MTQKYKALLTFLALSAMFTFLFPMLIPILLRTTHWGHQQIGLTVAAAFGLTALLQPAIGAALDRGRATLVALLTITLIAGGILLVVLELNTVLTILGVITFVSGTALQGTLLAKTFEGDIPADQRTKLVTIKNSVENAGVGVASVIAYLFLASHRPTLIVLDVLTTGLLLGTAAYLTKLKPKVVADKAPIATASIQDPSSIYGQLPLILGCWALCFAIFSHMTIHPILFERLGLPVEKTTAMMFALNTVVIALFGVAIGRSWINISQRNSIFIGSAALILGLGVLPWCTSLVSVACATVIWSVGELLLLPLISVALFTGLAGRGTGRIAGIASATRRLAMTACPLSILLFDNLPTAAFAPIMGGACLFGAGILHRQLSHNAPAGSADAK